MNPWLIAVAQLANVKRVERKVPKFNPRPPGVLHAGSASSALLQILRANPTTYYTHGRLMELTGRSHAAVSWGLKYLREHGLVRTVGDTSRNERWLKYAAVIGAANVEVAEKPRVKARSERLVRDAQALPESEGQGVAKVRGGGNQSLPAVAGEFQELPGGHGPAADAPSLAGPQGHQQALHARELPLDRADAAEAAPPVLPQGDCAGRDDDRSAGRTTAGTADQEHGPTPLGDGLQPGAPEAGEALQALDVAHVPGRDAAATRVGTSPWPLPECRLVAPQTRNAAQRALFTADAKAPAHRIGENVKEIAL